MNKLKRTKTIESLRLKFYRDEMGNRYYRWRSARIKRVRLFPEQRWVRWLSVLVLLIMIGVVAYPSAMRYASDKVIEKVADQLFTQEELEDLIRDPDIQKILEQLGGNPSTPVGGGVTVPTNGSTPAAGSNAGGAAPVTATIPTSAATPVPGSTPGSTSGSTPIPGSTGSTPILAPSPLTLETMNFSTNDEAMKFLLTKFSFSELKSLADKASGGLTKQEKKEIKLIVTERLNQNEFDSLKILAAMEIMRRQGDLTPTP
jgi:hypothetical protein